eukprot:6365700-Amphidinium_carterae.1
MAGFLVFMSLARARYDEVAAAERVELDLADGGKVGYFELVTRHMKTAAALGRSGHELRLVAPAYGVSGCLWAQSWLKDLQDASLVPASAPPVWWAHSTRGWSPSHHFACSTHSRKATTLSWCAKSGLSLRSRRLLGYHSHQREGNVLVYSRDALAQPLRELERVLHAVSSGELHPDITRCGCFTSMATHVEDDEDEHAPTDVVETEPSAEACLMTSSTAPVASRIAP